jgi:Zn-dependent membrane protease YugP
MFIYDPVFLLMLSPALLLAFFAQWRVSQSYAEMSQVPAGVSGAQAARQLLDASGLHDVQVEQVPGRLTDHYDPRTKVLRLSSEVYRGTSMAAVGIAAHEAGHAIQDADQYTPMVIRNLAVPVANVGSNIGSWMMLGGLMLMGSANNALASNLFLAGIVGFAGTVFFQLVNLPVEFDASNRAKRQLVEQGIIDPRQMRSVSKVLNAAALTYVAATLQAILTLGYYVLMFLRSRDRASNR